MQKLVLVRHGQSIWNLSNRFTGWTDVGLSEKGIIEAREAGIILKKLGYTFDVAYTSVLKRANDTLDLILEELNLENVEESLRNDINEACKDLPVYKHIADIEIREKEFEKTTTNKIKR